MREKTLLEYDIRVYIVHGIDSKLFESIDLQFGKIDIIIERV